MKKVIVTLAVLARFATPAFAQSFCDCNGSGNVLPFGDKAAASQTEKIAVRRTGLGSFAMVPGPGPAAILDGVATAGGGSIGYNEMLRNY